MVEVEQMDIREILGELQCGPILSTHRKRIDAILKHFHEAGLTLEVAGDSKHLGRCEATMRLWSREHGLRWPDYVPTALMTPAELLDLKERRKRNHKSAPAQAAQ